MPQIAAKPAHRKSTHLKSERRRGVTPEDLLHLQSVSDPQISPDGNSIVFVKKHVGEKNEYATNLWLADAALSKRNGHASPRQFTSGNKDSHPRWSPDGKRIAFIGGREKTKPQIFTISVAGGEATALTRFPQGTISTFRWSPDGSMIAVSFRQQDSQWTEEAKKQRKESGLSDPPRIVDDWWYRLDGDGYFIAQRHKLYIVDAQTGKHCEVYAKDTLGHTFCFDFSPDSQELVISTNRDRKAMIRSWKDELLRLNIKTGKLTAIPNLPEGVKCNVRWSPDGSMIAYAGRIGKDDVYSSENLELLVCDPRTDKARSLTAKEDYCLMAVAISDASEVKFSPTFEWAPDSKRIFLQLGWHGESHVASVAANVGGRGGKIAFHTRGQLMHNMGNLSGDGRKIALTIGSATKLDEVHVGNIGGAIAATALSDFNATFVRKRTIAKPQAAWATAADGTRVQVWMLTPEDFNPKRKYPAILQIHGGPHGQYGLGFFHEFQVLASAGYVVFFSNPRGSKGYGRDFCAAIRGNWGGKDWEDIQAVTKFMKAQPFVDSKRMGVMGGSYGGYMTNWVIGHTREFAGAITDRCVSNLVSMGGNSDYVDEPDRYWEGNFWDKPEARWNQSPMKYIGNAKTPTLIIHSEGDLRCNIEQAEQVFSALKLLNVPTRFVRYPTCTSHGMSRGGPPDMRIHRLHQILEWWRRWL